MRKREKRQILELIETIGQAQAAGLYDAAMDGAASVNAYIKRTAGRETESGALLARYGELLVKARNGETGEKALRKHLIKIENSVRSELKADKIEAVFFPYQLSMWDSLESVYFAAKGDPNCDAYVVPIPWYEKLPDGAFGKMRYDGDKYPKNIPITDWREYDAKARRPDIIFIHNPYDAGNYVTSVHPDFYSEKLKDCTDMLVYCPYFVSVSADDVGEHFCAAAACVHAHKTVVQSGVARETYIKAFKKAYGNQFGNPKDKFIALGSPKFDKVLNSKPEDFVLPESWQKLIYNADGGVKKIVLYNTRLTDMTAGVEKQLIKLKSVLTYFRTRTDVALWWRPHPLNMECMKSMRSHLAGFYEKIVSDYRREGWGIYDESCDLHRAIAWSAVYYGDFSSVAALCLAAGKPVMVADINVTDYTFVSRSLLIASQYNDNANFYFTSYEANALFRMDKQTWKAEYIGAFPGIVDYYKPVFAEIAECNGKLYFAPSSTDCIGVYDLLSGEFKSLAIKNLNSCATYKFHAARAYKEFVFFFGATYPAIIKLNVLTDEITYITDWVLPVERIKVNDDCLFFAEGHAADSKIFLSCQSANAIVVFDMQTCLSEIITIPSKNKGYISICFDGEYYWLSPRRSGGTVVKWNYEKGTAEISVPDDWANGDFWFCCHANEYTWYFPGLGNAAFKVNAATNTVETAEPFIPERINRNSNTNALTANYLMACAIDGIIYAHTGASNTHISYNTKTGELRAERIITSDGDRGKVSDNIILNRYNVNTRRAMKDYILQETFSFNINDLIERLFSGSEEIWNNAAETQLEICRKTINNFDGTAGREIYSQIKKMILL